MRRGYLYRDKIVVVERMWTYGENTKTQKKSWFKGLQAEFKKVIWPDKNTLTKQTTAVVAVSVILGALIAVIDAALKYGIDFLVK